MIIQPKQGTQKVNEMECEIEKLDHKFNVTVLCTGYSKETLKLQLKKKIDGIAENGPDMLDNKFWNSISLFELQEAISYYDEEQYRQIRDEVANDRSKKDYA